MNKHYRRNMCPVLPGDDIVSLRSRILPKSTPWSEAEIHSNGTFVPDSAQPYGIADYNGQKHARTFGSKLVGEDLVYWDHDGFYRNTYSSKEGMGFERI